MSTCTSCADGSWWLRIGNISQLIRDAPPYEADPGRCLDHLAARAMQLAIPDASIEVLRDGALVAAITIHDGKLVAVGLVKRADPFSQEIKRLHEDYVHALHNSRITLRSWWLELAARCDAIGTEQTARWAANCRAHAELAPVGDGAA